MSPQPSLPDVPWWRVKTLWLVIAGPLAVVLAGVATSVVAWHDADSVVTTPPAAQARDAEARASAPALQARNHAAAAAK